MTNDELPLAGRVLGEVCRELAAVKAERDALTQALTDTREVLADFRAWHERDVREMARLEDDAKDRSCAWRLYRDKWGDASDLWQTGCGRTWQYTADGPAENHQVYCHACGGRIDIQPAIEDADDEEADRG